MNRIFIPVTKGSSLPVLPGSIFTQEDFHGIKRDIRNKLPVTHTIDAALPRVLQLIIDWLSTQGISTSIIITSTRRTKEFNLLIASSGAAGAHTRGIALDFIFTGPNASSAWCAFKDEIVNRGTFFQRLLNEGLGGIGVYGNRRPLSSFFFHIDTRQSGDGLSRKQVLNGKRYGYWTKGNLDCDSQVDEEIIEEDEIIVHNRTREDQSDNEETVENVKYIHLNEGGETTIEDLINNPLFIGKDIEASVLLDIEVDGKKNHRRIYDSLSIRERRSQNNGASEYNESVEYLVTPGTVLYIPLNLIDVGVNYESNFTTTKKSFNDFFPPILKKLTTDPGYVPAYLNKGLDAKQIRPHARVFLWSKVKYLESTNDPGFIDITDDLVSVDTYNTLESGGDFILQLAVIEASQIYDNEESTSYSIQKNSQDIGLSKSHSNRVKVSQRSGDLVSEYKRNVNYYERIVSKNDMIFISYEKLNIDGKIEDNVEGKWYDMIGLVDHVETSSSGDNNSSVSVRGKSLIGVLMDDHSYFNPVSIGHDASIFGGDPLSNGRYLDSGFKELSSILARSIQENIEFIFHRISTIGYIPDDVFSTFRTKTTISKYTKNTDSGTVEEELSVKGIWQIISFFIDRNIAELRLADSSISNPEGNILELIQKTCQSPFVELFSDTYGDKFYLIARKPPFEQNALIEAVFEISNDIDSEFQEYDSGDAAAVGGANEGAVNKYLQETVFAKKSSGGETNSDPIVIGKENELDEVVLSTSSFPRIININEDDVVQDSLRMSSKGYAWYQLEEQGNFLGRKMGIGTIPAIYFDEIAQIFGNRRLTVTSNYTSLNFYLDKNIDANRNLYGDQIAQQLGFLVETNLHLPFTREGTLVLNPDRRLKVGNYIYYRPTKEIFYVTAVANTFKVSNDNVNRTTTVTVERGMKIKYIRDSIQTITDSSGETRQIEVSYFNIVNIQKLKEAIYDVVSKEKVEGKFDYKADAGINRDVLEFFLQNRQFDDV